MRLAKFFLGILLVGVFILDGQAGTTNPESDPQSASQMLLSCLNNWTTLPCLHYKLHRSLEGRSQDDYYVDMEWWMAPNAYRFSKKQTAKRPDANIIYDESFDGKNHMEAFHAVDTLRISSHDNSEHTGLWSEKTVVSPYEFLFKAGTNGVLQNFHELQDLKRLTDLFRKASLPKQIVINGHQCIVMDFPGGKDDDGYPYTYHYRVYFDKSVNYFPTKWEKVDDASGCVYSDYQVTKLSTIATIAGKTFTFPSESQADFYKLDPASKTTTLNSRFKYNITSLEVSQPDENDFAIDPSGFKYIVNADTGNVISVPK
jgi:hypothetical protein